jgi:hypothetical protein
MTAEIRARQIILRPLLFSGPRHFPSGAVFSFLPRPDPLRPHPAASAYLPYNTRWKIQKPLSACKGFWGGAMRDWLGVLGSDNSDPKKVEGARRPRRRGSAPPPIGPGLCGTGWGFQVSSC